MSFGIKAISCEDQREIWYNHGMDPSLPIANYIRRKDLLKCVGIRPTPDNTVHFLHFHVWPGATDISMTPNEVFGWGKEAGI